MRMADNKQSFRYEPLQPGSIRILELQPCPPGTHPKCRLVSKSIFESSQGYDAISYVWGDPARDRSLPCGDQTLWVPANLLDALTAFSRPDAAVRVWADAVCINQDDMDEREAQVSMMGLIYRKARRVLGYLGPDFGAARLAMEFILEFNPNPQEHSDEARSMILQADRDRSRAGTTGVQTRTQKWAAIKQFFQLPFFHRVWIIQELGLAAEAHLFCGQHQIPWSEVGTFVGWLDSFAADVVTHLRLESWVANHTCKVWRHNPDGTPKCNFVQVLHWARVHQATDPRDRIYAFLSHPSSLVGGTPLIRPKYDLTTNQVYTSLTAALIERTKNLHILAFVDHETHITTDDKGQLITPPLPSWVPDWHAPNLVAPLPCSSNRAKPQESDHLISILEDGKLLVVRALIVDTIAATSNMLTQRDIPIGTREAELQKKNPFFLDHLWDLCWTRPPNARRMPREVLDGISLSLAGEHRRDRPVDSVAESASEELDQHRADFAAYVREYEGIRSSDGGHGHKPPSFVDQLPVGLREELEAAADKGSAARFAQDATWVAMSRVVFRTVQRGSIGLGPRFIRRGDVCCRVAGSILLLVLRPVAAQARDSDARRRYTFVGPAVLPGYDMMSAQEKGTDLEEIEII